MPFRGNQSFKASPEFDSLRRVGDFPDHQAPMIEFIVRIANNKNNEPANVYRNK